MEAVMRAVLRSGLVGLVAAIALTGVTATATAQTPVGPKQHLSLIHI